MKRTLLLVWALLAVCPSAEAAVLGDARVPFSAERRVVVDGRSYVGQVFHVPGRQRHEQVIEGIRQALILHADRAQGWLVLADLKSYVEFAFPQALAELSDPDLSRTPLAEETVNGIRTTKYRVDHTARDGSRAAGHVWVSPTGIVMRLAGTITAKGHRPAEILMELSQVRQAPQDPALFEVPAGFVKLPSSALQPLLGGGRAG